MGKPFDLEIPQVKNQPTELIRQVCKDIVQGDPLECCLYKQKVQAIMLGDELNAVSPSMENQTNLKWLYPI